MWFLIRPFTLRGKDHQQYLEESDSKLFKSEVENRVDCSESEINY
jgi:hypothetical protein